MPVIRPGEIEIRLIDPGDPDFRDQSAAGIGDRADIGACKPERSELLLKHKESHAGLRAHEFLHLHLLALDNGELLEEQRLTRLAVTGPEGFVINGLLLVCPNRVG